MTPEEKAFRARELMAEECIQEAFRDIREGFVRQLEMVPIGDVETQHEVALMLQLLRQLNDKLVRYGQADIVTEHRKKHDSFIEKMRQRITT